jgi:shikimate dehydrogenase
MTKLFAVVGDPVAHSLSPLIHNRWINTAGLDALYVAVHLVVDDATRDLRLMAHEDGGRSEPGLTRRFIISPPGADARVLNQGQFHGLNITLPHKVAALKAAVEASAEARAIGAANTLVAGAGGWIAHNTDVDGFEAMLRAAIGEVKPGLRVLMIGAGGAARAAAFSLSRVGAAVSIANRTVENARALADELAPGARVGGMDELSALAAEADVVVNTASLGHAVGGHAGSGIAGLPDGKGRPLLDMSYGKAAAAVLGPAAAAGWATHDGLTMLVAQAAAAFALWFGIASDQASALAACRKAVEARG